jgi:hypothetical protein
VQAEGGHTLVYLLPGLTSAQRRAALQRTRHSACIGHGPALPAAGLARAIVADRFCTAGRNGVAAIHAHPALLIPPMIIGVSVALAYLLMASVSVRIRQPASALGPKPVQSSRPAPEVRPASTPGSVVSRPSGPARPGGAPAASPSATHPSPDHIRTRAGGYPYSSASPSRVPSLSPVPDPSTSPAPNPSPPPAPGPSPSATSSPAPIGPGSGGTCVNIGPLGVCLTL